MTQIQQGGIEVIGTGLVTLAYYIASWGSQRDCDHKKLGLIAVNALGAMTGVFIFVGCFEVMTISVLNGVWSGIAGIVITLATTTEIIKEFIFLGRKEKEVQPIQNKFGLLMEEGQSLFKELGKVKGQDLESWDARLTGWQTSVRTTLEEKELPTDYQEFTRAIDEIDPVVPVGDVKDLSWKQEVRRRKLQKQQQKLEEIVQRRT
jgi:hypothetical protein